MSTSAYSECNKHKVVVVYIDMKIVAMQYEKRPTITMGPIGEFTLISS